MPRTGRILVSVNMGVGGPEGRADEGGMNGHCCGQQEP